MTLSVYAASTLVNTFTSGNLYLALCATPPSETDTGSTLTEPVGGGYARILLSSANWISGTGGSKVYNAGYVMTPSADWGSLSAYAICDALTAGNMLDYGLLTVTVNAVSGSKVKLQAGSIVFGVA